MKIQKILDFLRSPAFRKITLWSLLGLLCLGCTVFALGSVALGRTASAQASQSGANMAVLDRYDMAITNQFSSSLEGILSIEKVYWLQDEDVVAPQPDQKLFGETTDPADIAAVLEAAEDLLDGQTVLFSPDRNIIPDSTIRYYLDDTILVLVWREHYKNSIYTVSEIKIAHASQLRRFLAGNEYGHNKQYWTTEMSAEVNAVLAASGDFYMHRTTGLIVYNGQVERVDKSHGLETCLVDDQGNLRFVHQGELTDKAEAQRYVDENNIRFSISFGPILVENGEKITHSWYDLGAIYNVYPRGALCQADDLHYYVITENGEWPYDTFHDLYTFNNFVYATGCDMAYTLDGGQTATIALNHVQMNPLYYGSQRRISDIFYFATAIPDGGK